MRTSAYLSVLLAAVPALAQQCNRDNCARAVNGGVSSVQHVSDCSTNLICTSTLSTVTSTSTSIVPGVVVTTSTTMMPATASTTSTISGSTVVTSTTTTLGTATVTSTVTPSPIIVTTTAFTTFARRSVGFERRQAPACSANTVPAYANICGSFARYSSACSCAGVVGSTTTVSTATSTITTTTTAAGSTSTVTVMLGQSTSTVLTTLAAATSTVTISVSSATTTTTTSLSASTTTTTSTIASATAPSCGNQGLQFAYYEDNQPAGLAADNQRFDPTVVKTRTPVFQGTTTSIGYINVGAPPAAAPVYGVSPANGTAPRQFNYIVNHRGYIFAQVGGTYQFRVSQVDDVVDTWLGGAAFSGWSNFNAASRVFFTGADGSFQRTSGTVSFFLPAGSYTAFRVIFKQNQGDASFAYSVVAPNGQEIIGQSTAGNQGVVQFSCDVNGGAAYPPFGAET